MLYMYVFCVKCLISCNSFSCTHETLGNIYIEREQFSKLVPGNQVQYIIIPMPKCIFP